MERGSDKHGPRLDDELAHETEGLVRAGRSTHAEEWKDPEPSGEDQPDADRVPNATLVGGTPPGMTPDDIEGRAELATYIGKEAYPAVRAQLIDLVIDRNAPDSIIDLVKNLPSDREFHNVNEIWAAVGGQVESERF
ncbi:MAG: hypothetical protein QOG53_3655 [Frankiales bacterium]|jgi:hypothetical protein|nr:hypothetical protein [Frankiales bacterium]